MLWAFGHTLLLWTAPSDWGFLSAGRSTTAGCSFQQPSDCLRRYPSYHAVYLEPISAYMQIFIYLHKYYYLFNVCCCWVAGISLPIIKTYSIFFYWAYGQSFENVPARLLPAHFPSFWSTTGTQTRSPLALSSALQIVFFSHVCKSLLICVLSYQRLLPLRQDQEQSQPFATLWKIAYFWLAMNLVCLRYGNTTLRSAVSRWRHAK